MNTVPPLVAVKNLDVSIGALQLVSALQFDLWPGELVCIIGCNGAGKTTLLHTLAGLREGHAGSIQLQSLPLEELSRKNIARNVALLLQRHDDSFPITVIEAVASARFPHRGLLERDSDDDLQVGRAALQRMGLAQLTDRDLSSLSGGERQRVAVAAVLAQQPKLYLLDEPLNNLDPRHQLGVMNTLRDLATDGATILTVMHDLNLVARYADRVLLLFGPAHAGAWLLDVTERCMTTDNLSKLYGTPVERQCVGDRVYFSAV